jgi:hypothetical protein
MPRKSSIYIQLEALRILSSNLSGNSDEVTGQTIHINALPRMAHLQELSVPKEASSAD